MTTPSNPGFVNGQVPTASDWNSYFTAKADYGGDGSFATVESTSTATAASFVTSSGPTWTAGTGAPTSTEPKGSFYTRTDGATGTTLYVSQGAGTWNAVAGV